MLNHSNYAEAIERLRPDIAVAMGDVLFGHKPGLKRKDVMGDRTLAWLKELVSAIETDEDGRSKAALFAPILPIEAERQTYYLDPLQDELRDSVSGLALYDLASIDAIPNNMRDLPRLFLGDATSPHKLLDAIALGVDAFTIPFIHDATDAGIALGFRFPVHRDAKSEGRLPLGIDMWSSTLANNVTPILRGCKCYACTNHHQAFIRHLFNAKEMLGWVLLQLHNHHIMDEFFIGIRKGIQTGSFEDDRVMFEESYVTEVCKARRRYQCQGYLSKGTSAFKFWDRYRVQTRLLASTAKEPFCLSGLFSSRPQNE